MTLVCFCELITKWEVKRSGEEGNLCMHYLPFFVSYMISYTDNDKKDLLCLWCQGALTKEEVRPAHTLQDAAAA